MQDIVQNEVSTWRLQLKKGTLELAVLSLLSAKPSYGLQLLDLLNQMGLEVGDGTIYPLLARLRKEGKVTTEWVDEGTGHDHKYYTLTKNGAQILRGMEAAWRKHKDAIERTIGGPK